MSSMTPETLSRGIDAVERNARGQLVANDRRAILRSHVPWAVTLLLVVPAMLLVWQLIRWVSGQPTGWFSLAWLAVLTVLLPAAAIVLRTFTRPVNVNRTRALIAMDRTLGSADRLATADEFLQNDSRNGFQQAAIEDANQWVEQGRIADVASKEVATAPTRRTALFPAIAIALLLLAFGLSKLQRPVADAVAEADEIEVPEGVTTKVSTAVAPQVTTDEEEPKPEEKKQQPRGKRPANNSAAPATSTPEEAEESKGQLTEGDSSESQQSSNPSSAQGAPSSQGQPSKPDEAPEKKKKKKNKQKPKSNEKKAKEQEKKEEEPSGATAGQGSSRGSNNNAAANDWASKSQQATKEDEDTETDDDAEDDDEEQESRGGVQPNLRDRRAPVNRDLNIGLGRARPNPDANGRGGPGAQKKSRGVASLILGVPIPDRITGQPNKGRTRITQQRITPEAENVDPVQAEDRGSRNGSVGPIHHPDFSPWLQEYVRKYFLKRRETADKKDSST